MRKQLWTHGRYLSGHGNLWNHKAEYHRRSLWHRVRSATSQLNISVNNALRETQAGLPGSDQTYPNILPENGRNMIECPKQPWPNTSVQELAPGSPVVVDRQVPMAVMAASKFPAHRGQSSIRPTCFCLRPENRPSVFTFFCIMIWWGVGGGVGGCNNVLCLRYHRFSSVNTLHVPLRTSVLDGGWGGGV